RRGRIHGQRRTEREHEIRFSRSSRRAFEVGGAQRLAETDRRRLQEPATRAQRWLPRRLEPFQILYGIARFETRQTLDEAIGTVHFDETRSRRPSLQMKAVNVLRHDAEQLPARSRRTIAWCTAFGDA